MLKQAGISGGVSSELRSAAVKMVFVKEENTSEPETWRIKHEEPKPRIIKYEVPEPEPCRINHEKPEPRIIKYEQPEPRIIKYEEPEPETCRIKQEEPEPEPRIIKHEDHGGWSFSSLIMIVVH